MPREPFRRSGVEKLPDLLHQIGAGLMRDEQIQVLIKRQLAPMSFEHPERPSRTLRRNDG